MFCKIHIFEGSLIEREGSADLCYCKGSLLEWELNSERALKRKYGNRYFNFADEPKITDELPIQDGPV